MELSENTYTQVPPLGHMGRLSVGLELLKDAPWMILMGTPSGSSCSVASFPLSSCI